MKHMVGHVLYDHLFEFPRTPKPLDIHGIRIDPNPDTSSVRIRATVIRSSGVPYPLHVKVYIDGITIENRQYPTVSLSLSAEEDEIDLTVQMPGFKSWSPQSPYLYRVTLEGRGPDVSATGTARFGMRKIHCDSNRIYLNGEPIFLRGNVWAPSYYALIPFVPEHARKLLLHQKKLGFNYIRHHTTVPPSWYFDLADEIGLMCSMEMGAYDGAIPKLDMEQCRGILHRYWNHPSIIFWAAYNEVFHTGSNPLIQEWYKMVKETDPSRLVCDCSGWGEFDRDTTDLLVQHYGYELPYTRDENMYSGHKYFLYNGSCKGMSQEELKKRSEEDSLEITKPQIVHELQGNAPCYSANSLIYDARTRRIWEAYHHDYAEWETYVKTNQLFLSVIYKLQIEAARRAHIQNGYEFMTVADSDSELLADIRWPALGSLEYMGVCDVTGEIKPWLTSEFPTINAAHILLIDSHGQSRSFWADDPRKITVLCSCFDYPPPTETTLVWRLKGSERVLEEHSIGTIALGYPGVTQLAQVEVSLPDLTAPSSIVLETELAGKDYAISNSWRFWAFPRRLPTDGLDLSGVSTSIPWLADAGYDLIRRVDAAAPIEGDLFISDTIGAREMDFLDDGGRILLLQDHCKPGFSCLPSSYRHRMYHPPFGDSFGVIVRDHPAIRDFPHEGFNDLQFYHLLNAGDRILLHDFPIDIEPILKAVPVLEQNQPRLSCHLFEVRVGKGALLASGLNLKYAISDETTPKWMLAQLIAYALGESFKPEDHVTSEALAASFDAARERVWMSNHFFWRTENEKHPRPGPRGAIGKCWQGHAELHSYFGFGITDPLSVADGYLATFWEPEQLPTNIGLEWPVPQLLAGVRVHFVDDLSIPADDGFYLDATYGESDEWQTVEFELDKTDAATWRFSFGPIAASRIRLCVDRMNERVIDLAKSGAQAGGPRSGCPFPWGITPGTYWGGMPKPSPYEGAWTNPWMENAVPRIRLIVPQFADGEELAACKIQDKHSLGDTEVIPNAMRDFGDRDS